MSSQEAIQAAPESTRAALKQLFERANAEQAAGRSQQAEATCREIIARDETHFGAWHLRGIIALRAGDAAAALGHVERAVALAPARADCRNSLGFVLVLLGRRTDAEGAFRKAVELDPNFFESHYQLGNIYRESRRFAEAEACYRRVLALVPNHAQAHNNLEHFPIRLTIS
jgi:Flp pilus assembly protein TadD